MDKLEERIEVFDICKGILIIMVVLGHIISEKSDIHAWIYSWHMPAFFIISGILLTYNRYIKKHRILYLRVINIGFRRLILPYFGYGTLLLFVRWMSNGFEISNLRWQCVDLVTMCGIGATWFLPCLFFARLIFYLINYICIKNQSKNIFKIVFLLILLIPLFLPGKINFFTLIVFRAMIATVFIIVGNLSIKLFLLLRKFELDIIGLLSFILIIVSVFVFIVTGRNASALNTLNFGNPISYMLNALIGSVMIFCIACIIDKIKLSYCKEIFLFFGRNSLIVMGTHQVLMLLLHIPNQNELGLSVIFCIIVMVMEIPCIFGINSIKNFKYERTRVNKIGK